MFSKDLIPFLLPTFQKKENVPPHWECLMKEAQKEEVFSLFYQRAHSHLPPPLKTKGECLYHTYLTRNIHLLDILKKIAFAFQKESISFLLFKGFDLSKRIYQNLWIRNHGDIDFILPPKEMAKAKEILNRLGFQENIISPGDFFKENCTVELHKDILHLKRFADWDPPPLTLQGMWERKTWITLDELTIPVLEKHDLFLALTLHFVFNHHLRGLKWLVDLAWFAEKRELDWALIFSRARDNHLDLPLDAALRQLKKHFAIITPLRFSKKELARHEPSLFWTHWNNKVCRTLFRFNLLPGNKRWRMLRETFFKGHHHHV